MQIPAFPSIALSTPAPARVWHWYGAGFRLWRRAPLSLLLFSFAPLVAEGLLQLVPVIGVLISKIVFWAVLGGVFVALDEVAQGGRLRARSALRVLRRPGLPTLLDLGVWMLPIFGFQLLCASVVYGPSALNVAVGLAPAQSKTTAFVLLLMISGQLPATLLMFALLFVLFEGLRPGQAAVLSVRTVLRAPATFGLMMITSAALMALAVALRLWPLLILVPWLTAVGYAAYRDVRPR